MPSKYLAPCPFCGEYPTVSPTQMYTDFTQIGCLNVGCDPQPNTSAKTRKQAFKQWNTRTKPLALQPLLWFERHANFGGQIVASGYEIERKSPKQWVLRRDVRNSVVQKVMGTFPTLWKAKEAAWQHHNAKTLKILAERKSKHVQD